MLTTDKRYSMLLLKQGRRNRGGHVPPPNFFKGLKVPFFVMKSALFCDEKCPFVQANVAVNIKLTSKVPFLLGNFQVFKKNLVKNVQFRYGTTGKFFSPPRRQHFRESAPRSRCPPQSFDASYAPVLKSSFQAILKANNLFGIYKS